MCIETRQPMIWVGREEQILARLSDYVNMKKILNSTTMRLISWTRNIMNKLKVTLVNIVGIILNDENQQQCTASKSSVKKRGSKYKLQSSNVSARFECLSWCEQ